VEVQQCLDGLEDERTIFRHPKDREHPYVMVAKATAMDVRVSPAARCLLIVMLCMPDDWDFNVRHLARKFGANKDTVAVLLRELLEARYVVRQQTRQKGRYSGSRYLVFEHSTVSENTVSEDTGHGETVSGETVSGTFGHTDTPDPETEDREERESPSPMDPPREQDSDQNAGAVFLSYIDRLHRKARGRKLAISPKDQVRLLELLQTHGHAALGAGFRRFIQTAPPNKHAHWFLEDFETAWAPPQRPEASSRPCPACGKPMAGFTCLSCGAGPGEEPGPRATAEDLAELAVGVRP
jgi:hypothetical protein